MTPSTSPQNLGLIYLTVFTSFLLISPSTQSVSQTIKIGSDGGYTDIVIQINDEVPEDHCPEILQNLKVTFFTELITSSSHVFTNSESTNFIRDFKVSFFGKKYCHIGIFFNFDLNRNIYLVLKQTKCN